MIGAGIQSEPDVTNLVIGEPLGQPPCHIAELKDRSSDLSRIISWATRSSVSHVPRV